MVIGFFDSDCGFCTKTVNFSKLLKPQDFVWVPYGADDGLLQSAAFSDLDRKKFVVAVSADSEVIARGPEVFWLVLELQTRYPQLRGLARCLAGIASTRFGSVLSWKAYRLIASNRMKLSGGDATCDLG